MYLLIITDINLKQIDLIYNKHIRKIWNEEKKMKGATQNCWLIIYLPVDIGG
jgi:hypothetical protein